MSNTIQYTIPHIATQDSASVKDQSIADSVAMPIILCIDSSQNDSSIIDIFTTDTHQLIARSDSTTTQWREGLYAEKRPTSPAENPWIVGLLILAFAFFSISYRRGANYLHHVFTSLFKTHNRGNLFGERTINENQLRLSLHTLTFITEGIFLYHIIFGLHIENSKLIIPIILICIAICTIYFLLQRGVYWLLGNIFSDRNKTNLFLDSFTTTNLFIGLFFTPLVLLMLFLPDTVPTTTIICLILYILSRLIIIYKGIRFFLPQIYNLLYIILYLCALEITPLILIKKLVVNIYRLLY